MLLPDSSTSAPVAVVTSQVQASKAYGLLSSLSFPPPLAGIHSGGTSSGWYRGSSSPTARKVSVPLLVEDRSTHQVVSLAAQQAMPSMGCLSGAWGNFEFPLLLYAVSSTSNLVHQCRSALSSRGFDYIAVSTFGLCYNIRCFDSLTPTRNDNLCARRIPGNPVNNVRTA
jgi:hypothetical protein